MKKSVLIGLLVACVMLSSLLVSRAVLAEEGEGGGAVSPTPEMTAPEPMPENPPSKDSGMAVKPATEMAQTLAQESQELADQIAEQQELLNSTQTDQERVLIQDHIHLLEQERRSLQGFAQ